MGDNTVNKTAYNVTSYLDLPSNFLINGGNTSLFYQNISNSSLNYNTLNITFNSTNLPDLSPGTVTIYLYAQGYNSSGSLIKHSGDRTLLTESVDIVLSCYNIPDGIYVTACGSLDGDYVAPPAEIITQTQVVGGTNRGETGLSTEQIEKLFQTQEIYELVRGKQEKFTLKVENPFDANLENVYVSVSGFLSQYLRVHPTYVNRIPINRSYSFIISIEAPEYFTEGKYYLNFTITGTINKTRIEKNNTIMTITNMKESRSVILIIHEISKEQAEECIKDIIEIVEQMNKTGLNTKYITPLIQQSVQSLENKDYSQVKSIYETIESEKEKALDTISLIEEVENKINEAKQNGIKVPKTGRLILLAQAALDRGDYTTSFERANDAKITLALETIGRFNPIAFIKNNTLEVIISTIVIFTLAYVVIVSIKFNIINRNLKSLGEEEDILLGLIKQVQRECFKEKKLSMEEYFESLIQYENRLNKVVQEIIEMETKKSYLLRPFKSKDERIFQERKILLNMIKETQELYLNSKKLETRVYENKIKSYVERLSEIDEIIASIEAEKEMKKQRFGWFKLKK
jgi:hypothetical protein